MGHANFQRRHLWVCSCVVPRYLLAQTQLLPIRTGHFAQNPFENRQEGARQQEEAMGRYQELSLSQNRREQEKQKGG